MKIRTVLIFIPAVLFPMAAYSQTAASENADAPEIDACRASGLIALKERSPTIKDVELDLDSVRVIKMNSKIGGVDIKAMVLGDASIEKKTSSKAKNSGRANFRTGTRRPNHPDGLFVLSMSASTT
jgi:hypothetical protein